MQRGYLPMAFYYVDFENVQLNGLEGLETLEKGDKVFIFCREMDVNRIRSALKGISTKASVCCRIVNCVSKNALDFELISDLFMSRSKCMKVIISKDKGFDAAIQKGLREGVLCFRSETMEKINVSDFWYYFKESGKEYVLK